MSWLNLFGACTLDYAYFLAFFTGGLVAFSEIASRYSDAPGALFKNYASWLYVSINGLSAVLVYCLSSFVDLKVAEKNMNDHPYILAIVSGVGAMAFLRSSIINIKHNGHNVDAGLNKAIQQLLDWVDRMYDRQRSREIVKRVGPLVKDLSPDFLATSILPSCMAAMENLTQSEISDVNNETKRIIESLTIESQAKSFQLGFCIARITGFELLQEVVTSLSATGAVPLSTKLAALRDLKLQLFQSRGDS